MTLSAGFSAATFFLTIVLGYSLQLRKLLLRHHQCLRGELPASAVGEGLLPFREFVSYLAFLLFALSGATRSYVDLVLITTRVPVIILATCILLLLARYGVPKASQYSAAAVLGAVLLLITLVGTAVGFPFETTLIPRLIDKALAAVSLFLMWGKLAQAYAMWQRGVAGGVSLGRELGLVAKDLTGLWYAVGVGSELFWVAVTHVLSTLSSGAIAAVKVTVDRRQVPRAS